MSFLKWLASNPEDSEETQLDLLNSSKPIRERVDGRTVRKDFARSIDEAGGSEAAYGVSTERMTRELFDCGSKELYESTGGKRRDRSSLPHEAQKAYLVGETAATHDLKVMGRAAGDASERDAQIVESVGRSSRKARKLFPW